MDNENLDNGLDNSILNNVPGSEMPETNMPEPEIEGPEIADSDISSSFVADSDMPATEMPGTDMPGVDTPMSDIPMSGMPMSEMPEEESYLSQLNNKGKGGKRGKKNKNKGKGKGKGTDAGAGEGTDGATGEGSDLEDMPKVTRKSKRIMRIEALENALSEGEVDPETIVSMYLPRRRARNFGSALLRLDRWRLALLFLLLLIAILFIVAFMQEKMGNFTINLNRLELFRKGIAISADAEFTDPTARLTANNVEDATNISIDDLPNNLNDIDGDHSGRNYMAYTYYVRNAGKEDVGYVATLTLESYAKGAEEAVRVALWRNNQVTIYAEPGKDGKPEEGCENFVDHDTVCILTEENFLVGNVDKYTVVIWMEGDDPECVDAIVGGSVEFEMDINALNYEDTSLFNKFVSDIKDTLTGEKPIDASGNDAPDYYEAGEVKWKNRRNK